MLRNCQQSKGTCDLFDCSCFIILKVMMDMFKMLQLFASFIFHYGVANLNKAILEKSNKVVKFCGSKIENTHLKGKMTQRFKL